MTDTTDTTADTRTLTAEEARAYAAAWLTLDAADTGSAREIADAIPSGVLPGWAIEQLLRDYAEQKGLTVRADGIVPDGISWQVSDGNGWDDHSLDVEDDPGLYTVHPSDWDGEGFWTIEWSLTIVDWGGWEDEVTASFDVVIDPPEPECAGGIDHDWRSPHSVLGGLVENPGVQGKGGGAVVTEVCAHCGTYKITDGWAQNPLDGTQGHTTVEYREADDASSEWVEHLQLDVAEWHMDRGKRAGVLRAGGTELATWSLDQDGDERRSVDAVYLTEQEIEDAVGWPDPDDADELIDD